MGMPDCCLLLAVVFFSASDEKRILAIFLVLTARSSNAKALPCSAQLLRHSAAVHTALLGSNTIC
ncbi:MAG: hypothetical protein H9847_03195, partial [Candidatus Anaerobiospirillum pullicola]|nr:hypothetical protein [Candidatus Anaerobiospirillum pullicola]